MREMQTTPIINILAILLSHLYPTITLARNIVTTQLFPKESGVLESVDS